MGLGRCTAKEEAKGDGEAEVLCTVKQSFKDDVFPLDFPFVNLFPEIPCIRFWVGGDEVPPREEIKLTLITIYILGFFYCFLPRFRTKHLLSVPMNLFQIVGGEDEKRVSYLKNSWLAAGVVVVFLLAGSGRVAVIRGAHVVANILVSPPHLFVPGFGEWEAPFVGIVS